MAGIKKEKPKVTICELSIIFNIDLKKTIENFIKKEDPTRSPADIRDKLMDLMNLPGGSFLIPLMIIEQNTFVEMRDCDLRSIKSDFSSSAGKAYT